MTGSVWAGVPAHHSRAAMQQVAENHLPLVAAVLRRFPHRLCEREELYQQGCVGLLKAISRFDPDRGTSFSTYAVAMIMGEMRMLHRQSALHSPRTDREAYHRMQKAQGLLSQSLGREPTVTEIASALRLDAADVALLTEAFQVASTDAPSPSDRRMIDLLPDGDGWELRMELRDLLGRLPREDMRLLLLRYHEGLSQQQTAQRLHRTQTYVSRRERHLLAELKAQWVQS